MGYFAKIGRDRAGRERGGWAAPRQTDSSRARALCYLRSGVYLYSVYICTCLVLHRVASHRPITNGACRPPFATHNTKQRNSRCIRHYCQWHRWTTRNGSRRPPRYAPDRYSCIRHPLVRRPYMYIAAFFALCTVHPERLCRCRRANSTAAAPRR